MFVLQSQNGSKLRQRITKTNKSSEIQIDKSILNSKNNVNKSPKKTILESESTLNKLSQDEIDNLLSNTKSETIINDNNNNPNKPKLSKKEIEDIKNDIWWYEFKYQIVKCVILIVVFMILNKIVNTYKKKKQIIKLLFFSKKCIICVM